MSEGIRAFRNRHAGEAVCLLANGSSILNHDLFRIQCAVMSMNKSYDLCWEPAYHVCLEVEHARKEPDVYAELARDNRLFVFGTAWPHGFRMTEAAPDVTFSRDLERGVVIGRNGVGSVAYVCLQLAAFMGFSPIYFLGLDLCGDHFHREWETSGWIDRQNELFNLVPDDLEVWNVGSPDTKCERFPKMTYDDMLNREAK